MCLVVEKKVLIEAMQKYNSDTLQNPDGFKGGIDTSFECAEGQVDYLLSCIPEFHQEEMKVSRNVCVVGAFMDHCKSNGLEIPEEHFNSFFNV